MEFDLDYCLGYNEHYNIQIWDVDKIPTEIPTNNFCLFNNQIVKLGDLSDDFGMKGCFAYLSFEEIRENAKSRVLELTKDNYLKSMWHYKYDAEHVDINKIQFPIYCVLNVKYDKDKSVIEKVVHDEIAKYKAEKEGL